MRRFVPAGLLLATLAACREEAAAPHPVAQTDGRVAAVAEAAEASLRARLRPAEELRQRGVQVFPQAMQGTFAVCGRAASARPGEAFLPYVAVVAFDGEAARVTDFAIGTTGAEAARVFIGLSERCFDGGGPPSARALAGSLPVLPAWSAADSSSGSTAMPLAASGPAEPRSLALRRVVTTSRHGADIRNAPGRGEVVRVAARSTTLEVFDEAPGGWLHVGLEGVAWGWLHVSVLETTQR